MSLAAASSLTEASSTLGMAAQQPVRAVQENTPGAFPETPGTNEEQSFSVNPIPKSDGIGNPVTLAAGEKVPDPSSLTSNTISSTVQDDPELKSRAQGEEQTFGVAPLPATGGIGNPITLTAGEKVPESSTITGHTTESNVKLDQASYEKADNVLPVLPKSDTDTAGAASEAAAGAALIGGLGPQTSNMIPESSMGMGKDASIEANPLLSSAAPSSTTAALAGQVPLEPRGVPTVVSESQQEAHSVPEASANPAAVAEKKETEEELRSKVHQAPVTSDDTHKEGSAGGITAVVAGGVAAAGAAVAGAAALTREKVTESTGKDPVAVLPESVQSKIDDMNAKSSSGPTQSATGAVPAEVVDSQKAAHVAPEASANLEAVHEKQLVESELKNKVPEVESAGAPAPTIAAATSATAPTDTSAAPVCSSGAPQLAPVAGVAPISMDGKGLNASADTPAVPPTTQADRLVAEASNTTPSRDVSPMTKVGAASTDGQTQPTVTTGVNTSKAPVQSTPTTPRTTNRDPSKRFSLRGTPDSSKSTDKSEKRKSFFARLKEKLK